MATQSLDRVDRDVTKQCSRCGEPKPLAQFAIHVHGRHGRRPNCKPCGAALTREWAAKNPDKKKTKDGAYYAANRDRLKQRQKESRAANPGHMIAYHKSHVERDRARTVERNHTWRIEHADQLKATKLRYQQANPGWINSLSAARRARKLQATPLWADRSKMKLFYGEAARLTEETGIPHHVDHIIPLKNKYVCGLHCEANLQVIPGPENLAKSNHIWPGMREDHGRYTMSDATV